METLLYTALILTIAALIFVVVTPLIFPELAYQTANGFMNIDISPPPCPPEAKNHDYQYQSFELSA